MKKRNNKRTGRNIFGEVCIQEFTTLNKKETSLQLNEIFERLISSDEPMEFTIDCGCLGSDESEDFLDIASSLAAMYFG